MMGPTITQDNS